MLHEVIFHRVDAEWGFFLVYLRKTLYALGSYFMVEAEIQILIKLLQNVFTLKSPPSPHSSSVSRVYAKQIFLPVLITKEVLALS